MNSPFSYHKWLMLLAVCVCLPGTRSTMVELMENSIKDILPCAATCFFEKRDVMFKAIMTQCYKQAMQDWKPVENMFTSTTDPVSAIFDSTNMCTLIKNAYQCSHKIIQENCGDTIADKMEETITQALDYMNCYGSSKKGKIFTCMKTVYDQDKYANMLKCFGEMVVKNQKIIDDFGSLSHKKLYNEYFSSILSEKADICIMINNFTSCVTTELKDAGCTEAVDVLEEEVGAMMKFINCKGANSQNDYVQCLAHPELGPKIETCVKNKNTTDLESSIGQVTNNEIERGILPDINVPKLCVIVDILDDCIENPLKEVGCSTDRNTYKTFKTMTEPIRDYLLIEACGKPSKASNEKGAGECRDKYTDFTYGEPSGRTSSGLAATTLSLYSIISTLCLSVMVMLVYRE